MNVKLSDYFTSEMYTLQAHAIPHHHNVPNALNDTETFSMC